MKRSTRFKSIIISGTAEKYKFILLKTVNYAEKSSRKVYAVGKLGEKRGRGLTFHAFQN